MHTLGFIWRSSRRHPALTAALFLLVGGAGVTAAVVLPGLQSLRLVIAAGSVIGAMAVALLGATAMDLREGPILDPWQLHGLLKVDVLAEFDAPLMGRVRAELFQPYQTTAAAHAPAPQTALAVVPRQEVNAEPPAGMATPEQFAGFRELRTRLLNIAANTHVMPFTTLVVPLVAGSGGSFVARNLAASFAFQDGASALLIDCNRTNPSQHVAFRTSEDGGLFDFLEEPTGRLAPKPTSIRGLHLLPSGRPRSEYREYFSSSTMRSLIQYVRESGRFVFLDGPPASGSPDARILSEMADFVVLVVAARKGRTADIAKAAAMFDRAKLAGVVFNERP
jgi:protein-tyrosine kinase